MNSLQTPIGFVVALFLVLSSTTAASSLNIFRNPQPWTKDVSNSPKSNLSDQIINQLVALGGFGKGHIQMDFSINVVRAPAGTPKKAYKPNDAFYVPDCDCAAIPIPAKGAVEGSDSYTCQGYEDYADCHLLVVDQSEGRLYELYRANIDAKGVFEGGCLAVWNLNAPTYPYNLRGAECTSADAGGFPITAMLFNADEVASGNIDHAIRFILPNNRIARKLYVAPGTHSTGATSGPLTAPPYGVRFRLKKNVDLSNFTPGARVIARALQKYGMFLADGGTIALTGQSDLLTTHKWADVGVDEHSLDSLGAEDFEVVDMGEKITYRGDCVRNTQPAFAPVGTVEDVPAVCNKGAGVVKKTTTKRKTTLRKKTTSKRKKTTTKKVVRKRTSTKRKKTSTKKNWTRTTNRI